MRSVSFEELQDKEVINLKDCKRLGYISDIKIDIECGKIISFTVKSNCSILPTKSDEVCVPWENISKIGDDLICVDIACSYPQFNDCSCKKKFFSK